MYMLGLRRLLLLEVLLEARIYAIDCRSIVWLPERRHAVVRCNLIMLLGACAVSMLSVVHPVSLIS